MDKQLYLASNLEEQRQYLTYLKGFNNAVMAVDTETTGVDSFDCDIMGVSISVDENEGFYFPIHNFVNDELKVIEEQRLIELQSDLNHLFTTNLLVMHNASFDVHVLRNCLEIDTLNSLYCDTLLLKHTIDEQRPHDLKNVSALYFGESAKDEQTDLKESVLKNGGKWLKETKDMYKADFDVLGRYAAQDTCLTLKLYNFLSVELQKQGLVNFFYKDEVMPLCKLVIDDLIGHGVKCDLEYFNQLKKDLSEEATRLEIEAHADLVDNHADLYNGLESQILSEEYPLTLTGNLFKQMWGNSGIPVYHDKHGKPTFVKKVVEEAFQDHPESNLLQWKLELINLDQFMREEESLIYISRKQLYLEANETDYVINLGSNKQLKDLLFNRLGEESLKYTKAGDEQVDLEVLSQFATKYAFISKILEWRKVEKLLTTYVEGVLSLNKDGILRSSWLQHGTDSGRLSSRSPNMQNLPRDDKRIKYGFIAREGYKLVAADYAQIEPRTFASVSGEQALIDSFIHGVDFYGTVAVGVNNLKDDPNDLKKTNPKARQDAKEIALGIPYGMKKWKLARILGCSLEEAQEKIDKYWETYPTLHQFMLQCHGEVLKNHYVRAETGRIRRFRDVAKLKASRNFQDKQLLNKLLNIGINFKIQATASGIINRAAVAVKKRFNELSIDGRVVLQVHDELVSEVVEHQADLAAKIMKEVMEGVYKLQVPLIAEPIVGVRLSECK